jgi:hypothetical protein
MVLYEVYQRFGQQPPTPQLHQEGTQPRRTIRRKDEIDLMSDKTEQKSKKEEIVPRAVRETDETANDRSLPKETKDPKVAAVSPPASFAKSDKNTSQKSWTTTARSTNPSRSAVATNTNRLVRDPPRIQATTNKHPGMGGFCHWCDVETSLYRIYTLTRKDGAQVAPPYIPHSYRGNTPIHLVVHNSTSNTIQVYWVDYKGAHVPKGKIKPNHSWTQLTWIDHPWVFGDVNDETVYLYYIPYRAIPTLPTASTVNPDDTSIAQHQFSLIPSKPNDPFSIGISDAIMPFPSSLHHLEPLHGITWTLTHMSRLLVPEDPSIDVLQKFLTNIFENPQVVKYRQLRTASRHFKPIWESAMRGLLLAVGFVEQGGYAELGCHDYPLSPERVQEVALLSYLVKEWKSKPNAVNFAQPQGAVDGFGRAGFGRAGTIN